MSLEVALCVARGRFWSPAPRYVPCHIPERSAQEEDSQKKCTSAEKKKCERHGAKQRKYVGSNFKVMTLSAQKQMLQTNINYITTIWVGWRRNRDRRVCILHCGCVTCVCVCGPFIYDHLRFQHLFSFERWPCGARVPQYGPSTVQIQFTVVSALLLAWTYLRAHSTYAALWCLLCPVIHRKPPIHSLNSPGHHCVRRARHQRGTQNPAKQRRAQKMWRMSPFVCVTKSSWCPMALPLLLSIRPL